MMNRREALSGMMASLGFGDMKITEAKVVNEEPRLLVFEVSEDCEAPTKCIVDAFERHMRKKLDAIGWSKTEVVLLYGCKMKQPMHLHLPPNTVFEQYEDYSIAYPVGKNPNVGQ